MRNSGGGWNRGRKVGQKRSFTPEQIQVIRYTLNNGGGDLREIALFEVALSVMLRSSDLLELTIGDVVEHGGIAERMEVRQQKSGRGVVVHLSARAREALSSYVSMLNEEGVPLPQLLEMIGTRNLWLRDGRKITRLRYASMVKGWAKLAHLDPRYYATHSMRRTMAAHIYHETKDHEAVRQLLGHQSIASTSTYLSVDGAKAIEVKKKYEI